MTPDYIRYNNNINNIYHDTNETNNIVINRMINNFNNHRIINRPIDQLLPNPVGIPIVDGYIFDGWDEDPMVVRGQLTNETNYHFGEELIPVGKPVTIGRPIFPRWAFDVCVICGIKI